MNAFMQQVRALRYEIDAAGRQVSASMTINA
jgi:hypothetical protein